jgi:guanylate cyclase
MCRLTDAGMTVEDQPEVREKRRLQLLMAWASIPAVGLWGSAFAWIGHLEFALYPWSYCLGTLAMISAVAATGRFSWFKWAHPLLVILGTYSLHWRMGGFLASGGAVLWGLVGLVAALMFLGPDRSFRWMIGFLVLMSLTWIRSFGPLAPEAHALTPIQIEGFLFFNLSGFVLFTIHGARFFMAQRQAERDRAEALLRNILPGSIAERLKREADVIADRHPQVTVLFSDLVGFTKLSQTVSAEELVGMLDEVFREFDALADRHGLEKIKTIGDAYMAVAGLPEAQEDHAARAAAMAQDMVSTVERLAAERGQDLAMRIGLHSGEVVAGVIGARKFAYDLWGDTVNTASRMESHGEPGRVQLSSACREALGDAFPVERRGTIEVKGKGTMETYWLCCRS